MEEKEIKGGDFRYAVGESKVPWHAVGEFFNGNDALELVRFLLPDSGDADYDKAVKETAASLNRLAAVSGRATKLTLGRKVTEAEEAAAKYFGSKYACFLTSSRSDATEKEYG